jgi:para-nitrobenzyl esterase
METDRSDARNCPVTVQTPLGKIQGFRNERCNVFLGVPYAKPPVGELRWRPTQKVEPWEGVYLADRFPAKCPQPDMTSDPLYGKEFYDDPRFDPPASEDCLYMNLYVPREAKNCPVVVWIHGGAFEHGHCSEKEFDGTAYASRGILFAAINYRLGVFGFLGNAESFEEDHTTGNYGLLDQLTALQFIHQYISAFGGNPDNVTIMGQSAGSFSVQTLWASPLGEGLFHKVIMFSGCGLWEHPTLEHSLQDAFRISEQFLMHCGVRTLDEMRKLPEDLLMKAYNERMQSSDDLLFGPVVDGYVLKSSVLDSYKNGTMRPLPCVLGATSNDINAELPTVTGRGHVFDQVASVADSLTAQGSTFPYVYYFSHALPGSDDGAFHSSELWYVFGTLNRAWRPWKPEDWKLSEKLLAFLSTFIRTGAMGDDWSRWNGKDPYLFE